MKPHSILAAAIRVAMGAAPLPDPPAYGLDVNKHFRIEGAPPGHEHEPAAGTFKHVGDVLYVRTGELPRAMANLKRARAKAKYADRHK